MTEEYSRDILLSDKIEPVDIPFMHYGIVNRYNFKDIYGLPIKRWDPLIYNPITLYESGKFVVLKKNYGHYSYISPIRGKRPSDYDKKKKEPSVNGDAPCGSDTDGGVKREAPAGTGPVYGEPIDIFEPMVVGRHYIHNDKIFPAHSIIITDGEKEWDNPFTDIVKVHPPAEGKAVTMINKYPAMIRIFDEALYPRILDRVLEFDPNTHLAFGVCTLTIPTDFYDSIQNMPDDVLAELFLSMKAAVGYVIKTAVEINNVSIIPISPFFNIGRIAGGSLRRIHSQVYMDLTQDGHGTRMELLLRAFESMKQKSLCHLCMSKHGEGRRIILETDKWVVFANGSPVRNYHLRCAPQEHIEHIGELNREHLMDFARVLKVLCLALDDMGVNPNRNIIINTKPYGYKSFFHLFLDILPYEYIGGAEMADDMRVVRIPPAEVAANLREIIRKKYSDML